MSQVILSDPVTDFELTRLRAIARRAEEAYQAQQEAHIGLVKSITASLEQRSSGHAAFVEFREVFQGLRDSSFELGNAMHAWNQAMYLAERRLNFLRASLEGAQQ